MVTLFKISCLFLLTLGQISRGNGDKSKILDTLFNGYDRRVRPYYNEKPVEVTLHAFILDIFDIDEIRQEFTVNMYLRHHWRDSRLKFKPEQETDRVLLDEDHSKNMWIPDTFIVNQRKLEISSGSHNEATMILSDGNVVRSTRIMVTSSCKFDLSYFPFDKQICSLEFKSYGHTASDVFYKWKKTPNKLVDISEDSTNTRYSISSVEPKELHLSLQGFNISGILLEFKLERFSSRYLSDVFFPVFVLTNLSFLTLLINRSDLSIQISSALLATMTIFTSVAMGNTPKVSYQTAVDVYLLFSYIFVCIVVITNFLLGYLNRANNWGTGSKDKREAFEMEQVSTRGNFRSSVDTLGDDKFKLGRPNCISSLEDTITWTLSKGKILLPIMFVTFNIAYWIGIAIGSSKSNWEPGFVQEVNDDIY